jgi:hypothetical protein
MGLAKIIAGNHSPLAAIAPACPYNLIIFTAFPLQDKKASVTLPN